jgi:alpha-amylase
LSDYLHYDDHERRGALVRLMEPGIGPEALRHGATPDRMPIDAPWSLERLGLDRIDVRRVLDDLVFDRRLRIGGPRRAPWLEVEVEVENRSGARYAADLGLEWNICLSGGGGNPAAYYELDRPDGPQDRSPHDGAADHAVVERLAFGNDHDGVRFEATAEPPARVTWFPIETVSNSEGGFERVYQGSALLFRWQVDLEAGATMRVWQRFAIQEARDEATEASVAG